MSEDKAYKGQTEMEADIWFGGQLDKVKATIAREKRLALEAETKRFIEAKKGNNHFYPYGEPDCLFCGAFGPVEDDEVCRPIKEAYKQVIMAQEYLGNGVDDARWEPGTTAVESLIRENKELMEDRMELVASRLALSKGMGVEKGHLAPLIESLHGRIEELTGILQERSQQLSEVEDHLDTFKKRQAKLCPHGFEFPAECPECSLKIPVT